jgi:uncharacterized membrane protein
LRISDYGLLGYFAGVQPALTSSGAVFGVILDRRYARGELVVWNGHDRRLLATVSRNEGLEALTPDMNAVGVDHTGNEDDGVLGPNCAYIWFGRRNVVIGKIGGTDAVANWVNKDGVVAGVCDLDMRNERTKQNEFHTAAFRYFRGHADVLTLARSATFGFGVNTSGQVVGRVNMEIPQHGLVSNSARPQRLEPMSIDSAFVWTNKDVRLISIPQFGHLTHDLINDRGQVCINYISAARTPCAIFWDTMHSAKLESPYGESCQVNAMNNSATLVGCGPSPAGVTHALIWRHRMPTDLNTLGITERGIVLYTAIGLNDHGQVLALGGKPGSIKSDTDYDDMHLFVLTGL